MSDGERWFCSLGPVATDGASWADAQVPRDNFTAGDCSKHFCMLLVADYSNYLEYDETHATR